MIHSARGLFRPNRRIAINDPMMRVSDASPHRRSLAAVLNLRAHIIGAQSGQVIRSSSAHGLRDRSSRPLNSPNATKGEVVEKIIYLRKNCHFGPQKIAMYLKRYHDIDISDSGVWRILKRLDMSRLPTSQRYKRHKDDRWKRYEKALPGHRIQIDVKFVTPIGGPKKKKYYQFTAIDDCTRLRILRIYDKFAM